MRSFLLGVIVVVAGASCVKEKKGSGISGSVDISPQSNVFKGAGKLVVKEVGDKDIAVTGTLNELAPGNYIAHLHAPLGCPPPTTAHQAEHHFADLGTITADASGTATIDFKTPGRLGGANPLTGYCVVIYPPDLSTYVASGKILTAGYGLGPK